jgi:alkyl hydroperoxide reductase subunit AhpC
MKVGEEAPEFELEGTNGRFSLSKNKGKWTVLFFYPLDFTYVCPTEVTAFSKAAKEFEKELAEVYGISVDSVAAHKAWIEKLGGLNYPLLSDINKEVSRKYGVLLEKEGIALRGLFIIDPDGILQYMVVHNNNVGRSVQETLRVLKALKTGELCPVEWKQGEKTLGKA